MNKDRQIEKNLFGIFFIILLYNGKVMYAKSTLLKRIVIIGRTSINNRTNARMNITKGTIL